MATDLQPLSIGLYADTAAEGSRVLIPAVRARSLQATIEVYDWWNGVDVGPFPRLIEQAAMILIR